MITGHTEKHRVEAARDAGVTEFLAKPITAAKPVSRASPRSWSGRAPLCAVKAAISVPIGAAACVDDYAGPWRRAERFPGHARYADDHDPQQSPDDRARRLSPDDEQAGDGRGAPCKRCCVHRHGGEGRRGDGAAVPPMRDRHPAVCLRPGRSRTGDTGRNIFDKVHEIRGFAETAGLVTTGRIADILCRYMDDMQRIGKPLDAHDRGLACQRHRPRRARRGRRCAADGRRWWRPNWRRW